METIRTVIKKWAERQGWDEATQRDLILDFVNNCHARSLDSYLSQIAAQEQRWTNAQIGPIERLIDCIPLENLKSWIANLFMEIKDCPSASAKIVDEYVEQLQPLATDGAKTFEKWRKCPECGECWDDDLAEIQLAGFRMLITCSQCDTTFHVFFRPTREPTLEIPF